VGVRVERVLLQVDLLQAVAPQQGLHLHIGNEILAGIEVDEGGQVEEDGRQADHGVGADVESLELGALGHLLGQDRHPVVGQVQLCELVEGERELGRDLRDGVVSQRARYQGCIAHEMVDGVWHLHQLTVRQI